MLFRAIPVEDVIHNVVVDSNGLPLTYVDNGVTYFVEATFSYGNNNTLTASSDASTLAAIVEWAGGSSAFANVETTDDTIKYVDSEGRYVIVTTASGSIVEGTIDVYLSSSVIPAVGAVQVFADQACTRYAGGIVDVAYVRTNRAFGVNGEKSWGGGPSSPDSHKLNVYTPTTASPDDPYAIAAYIDYMSENTENAFALGDVIACPTPGGGGILNGNTVIFRDE